MFYLFFIFIIYYSIDIFQNHKDEYIFHNKSIKNWD